ncbi:hypothetical protein ABZX88_30270 [Kitasatospora aureofaciens]|uniref:hypothetical protein n=1 Tax=Kitasatospora aureofaciens TaxID=1894 RepID=UPI0033AF8241
MPCLEEMVHFFIDPVALEAGLKLMGLGATVVDLAVQALRRRTRTAAPAREAVRPRRAAITRKSSRRLGELRRLRQRHAKAAVRPAGRRSVTRRACRVGPASRRP